MVGMLLDDAAVTSADGGRNPAWDSISDQLKVMLHQEVHYYPPSIGRQSQIFDEASSRRGREGDDENYCCCITWSEAEMIRRKMTEWAHAVVDAFEYNRDVVAVCLNLVDRYVSAILEEGVVPLKRKSYQGIFVVGLYVALKLQGSSRADDVVSSARGGRPPSPTAVVNISVFANLSRGMLTVKRLEAEERNMMSRLTYRLNAPVFGTYIEYFILFLIKSNALQINPCLQVDSITTDAMHFIFEVARYLTELATFNVNLTTKCRPSCVAAASILHALDYLRQRVGCTTIPQSISTAFESNVLHVIAATNGSASDIQFARAELDEICPSETLDAWPGGWPSCNDEPPKDQILQNASKAPDSPLGVADAELI
eukprot:CAMPEP_0181040032 /NCGR_PEP_ID=MMETSP1070-20121207/10821_1 /TAXON_ID=265543 /ORGANISM="Minutocellus polymorphus, Strain NH13" /LENGTH=369 /DNA_ID=CAMNT_0023117993 /DNA_START=9 /DNA_END=1118 /DNA_ORIENTATION=-